MYVVSRPLHRRKQLPQRSQQIINLARGGMHRARVRAIRDLGSSNQHLLVPWNDENRTPVDSLGVDSRVRPARKFWQHNVRAAHSSNHGMVSANIRTATEIVGPGPGWIDNPAGLDVLFFSA